MQLSLIPHPAARPTDAELKVWADVEHAHILGATASTKAWFCVGAPIERFAVPPPADPARVDGLWQATCFEMFLKRADGDSYREWNFAPSGEWAVYDFASYRGEPASPEITFPPEILVQDNLTWWQVGVTVAVEQGPWLLGLSAVLEEADGAKSYWALAHPPGDAPDFHAADCFAARLA